MNAILSLGLLLTFSCAAAPEPARPENSPMPDPGTPPRPMMSFTLEAEREYRLGEAAPVVFTLKNESDETLFVLDWYTPLEGLYGDIFVVTRDGEEVEYQGILAKRGNPLREDYVRLDPDEEASAEVDLARGYDLSVAGEYKAEFKGRIWDVTSSEGPLPREQDAHRGVEIPGNAVAFRVVAP